MIKNKRSQQEIAGFIAIVVIVMIIGVIILSLMIKPTQNESTSAEISALLQASMHYTSDCAVSYIPNYRDGQDLAKSCLKNEMCLDGRSACEALNSTLRKIISESLSVHKESKNKAYQLKVNYYPRDSNYSDLILDIEEGEFGNCSKQTGSRHTIDVITINPGKINLDLRVCKGEF